MHESTARHGETRRPVMFVTFPGREGGPQAWFSQVERHPRFQRVIDARVWRPKDVYRNLSGKIRLMRDCRKQYANAGRPPVVYVSLDLDFAAQIVFGLRLAGADTIIVHAHATCFGPERSLKLRLYKWIVRTMSDHQLAVSEAAGQSMFGRGLESVTLLPAFVDYGELLSSSEEPAQAMPDAALTDMREQVVFACVGRLAESKNLAVALEAFARMRKTNSGVEAKLLLLGSGPAEQQLRDQIRRLELEDDVLITGWVDHVEWYLRHVVDCVLMPSLHEGAPRAVLEAQGFGCSVVVSGAVPEFCLFREDLTTRLTELSPERWAVELARILRLGKKTVGNSIDIARRHPLFSIEHGIPKLVEILEPARS